MSFRKNTSQQVTFEDSLFGLTARERKALNGSWAKYFADEIFPYIDEEPFRVLYSEKDSRPNTPVNICVAALIIKELQGASDEEMVENLMLDQRYQLAMHTTSYAEQPLSDKTLQRFRNRCAKYLEETGTDLIHDCITALADRIREALSLSGRLKRMDSLMIAANIKQLNRMQLLYTCVRNLVKRDEKLGLSIPEQRQHYLDSSDYNRVFYYANSDENAGELERILEDAADLLACTVAEHQKSNEYAMLKRCMEEQTITDEESGELRLRTKEDGGMHSGILQNPSDPDATYREKAGKSHRGYVANVEETAGENGSVVTDYQVEANNYSDNQFLQDSLERMETPADPADPEETVTLVADGAYAGPENQALAEEKNVNLMTTDLAGQKPDPVFADFVFSADGRSVLQCPAGHAPARCGRPSRNGQIILSFERSLCAECPHREQCRAQIHKRVSNVRISLSKHERARFFASRNTQEFQNMARFRNGVETVPSTLRQAYGVDRMPCRGKAKTTILFGCKIGALNFRKLLAYRRRTGNYAQNPVLSMG